MYVFGRKITIDLFGKSHAPCIGCIIKGLPQGMDVDMDMVSKEMELRKPTGRIGTPRRETDTVEYVQGIVDGKTDGNPLLIRIANGNTDSSKYQQFYDKPRPGHADLPALIKFPEHDLSGSGQFSGRLTAALVACGAIAKQFISKYGISIDAYARSIGPFMDSSRRTTQEARYSRKFATRACDEELDNSFRDCIEEAGERKDSIGGTVECIISGLPIGFGGIWFEALDAELAHAMFGIPACKGVEFGDGFALAFMHGSESNDPYRYDDDGRIVTEKNSLGGIVGGMCDGADVTFRVAFKPTPSIEIEQETVNLRTEANDKVVVEGRHDPCIVPRAVAVVEAMAALTIADQIARGL